MIVMGRKFDTEQNRPGHRGRDREDEWSDGIFTINGRDYRPKGSRDPSQTLDFGFDTIRLW